MTTDYDAPRVRLEDEPAPAGDLLRNTRRPDSSPTIVDNGFGPAGGLLLETWEGEDLSVSVVAQRSDELTCTRCFLIHHRSRFSPVRAGRPAVCRDCS